MGFRDEWLRRYYQIPPGTYAVRLCLRDERLPETWKVEAGSEYDAEQLDECYLLIEGKRVDVHSDVWEWFNAQPESHKFVTLECRLRGDLKRREEMIARRRR